MFNLPNTLSFRLTLWYAVTFIIILLVALIILYIFVNTTLNARIDEDLIEGVSEFRAMHNKGGLSELKREIENEALDEDSDKEFIRLLNKDGKELLASDLSRWNGIHTIQTTLQKTIFSHPEPILESVQFKNQDDSTRIVYGLITADIILQKGESTEEKNELMELLALVFIPLFLIVIPIATFAGWRVAKQATRGINEVSHAVAELEKGDFNHQVSMHSQTDEIQTLVDTFNSMSARIKTLMTEMKEMIDNIAHDLRSPIGRIRAISETTLSETDTVRDYRTAASDTLEECDRLIRMINTTLDVAEAEAGVGNDIEEDINLSHLVEEACELFSPAAEEKHIKLAYKTLADRHIKGNQQNILRMLANLLDNALKYTPEHGQINVNLSNNPEIVRIEIKDSGIGIPANDQERIFDRFYRCDSSRSTDGCGLGLSFSLAVAKAHNGNIQVDSSPNIGSTFIVTLPKYIK